MIPADRERIEAALVKELDYHYGDIADLRNSRVTARCVATNIGQAAHELGRESALGEIETALRELGSSRTVITYYEGEWHVAITVDEQTRQCGQGSLGDALLAAIDAVNEMRAAEALARRNVL